MATDRDRVVVHLDAAEIGPRQAVGSLARERAAAKSVISFAYEPDWVSSPASFALDPSLPLYEGEQYQPALPGIFADAAPDRWGRTLMERREALAARREGRRQRGLDDWDYLVGVNDRTRMGALRLARADDDGFLDDGELTIPPSTQLRDLEHWARELEHGLPDAGSEEERWIASLIAPGSSLGGARPKASFLDDGALWIAKFPSREDRHDVGGWEYVVSRLAAEAGIEVPETRLLRLASPYRTFCARRFDRLGESRRLYASAMTLAGRRDHEDAGYLDIARAIVIHGDPAAIEQDLQQLFRRVVFNVLTADRDDHLRNHGFLRTAGGWRLSPAFDVNPSPQKQEHSLALDDSLRVPDLDIVRETAPHYRLTAKRAEEIIGEVDRVVAGWPAAARDADLPEDEVERFAAAFLSA
jgi:serine/threonine-protein kinase HipA